LKSESCVQISNAPPHQQILNSPSFAISISHDCTVEFVNVGTPEFHALFITFCNLLPSDGAAVDSLDSFVGELVSLDDVDVGVDVGSVGELVVGALVVGELVVGSLVVSKLVVGALVVGELVVGALVVGELVVGTLVVGELVVGTLVVGELVVGAFWDGTTVGTPDGATVGVSDGATVGASDGATVGNSVGAIVGEVVGNSVGDSVDIAVLGDSVDIVVACVSVGGSVGGTDGGSVPVLPPVTVSVHANSLGIMRARSPSLKPRPRSFSGNCTPGFVLKFV
jgi:hypothetical protein